MKIPEIYSVIPEIFPGQFPDGYINNVQGWGTPESELHSKLPDGTYKMLTLDVDLGKKCSLNCPHCYKRNPSDDIKFRREDLSFEELLSIITDAKAIGLKSIKIMGAGDPFENPQLIPFLQKTTELDIHVAIFTKGHVIGNDVLVNLIFGKYGIHSGKQLADQLYSFKTSILLGFNSFFEKNQLKYIGGSGNKIIENYYTYRNNALTILLERGFNNYDKTVPTRLAFIAAPFYIEDFEEIFEMYKWARRRNIYFVTCPTVDSGKGRQEIDKILHTYYEKYFSDSIEFYTRVYIWNIQNNLQSIEQFEKENPSLYPGAHPCNQTASGLYINVKGVVQRCPGFDFDQAIEEENILNAPIAEIWKNSQNYKLAARENQFNFFCIAREVHLFPKELRFFQKIKENVTAYFEPLSQNIVLPKHTRLG